MGVIRRTKKLIFHFPFFISIHDERLYSSVIRSAHLGVSVFSCDFVDH